MKWKLLIASLFLLTTVGLAGCGLGHQEAKYLGDRSVQYDEANKCHQVFFAFYASEDSPPMKQDADITLTITNDDETVVYNKTFSVTEDNYGEWTNALSGTRMLGCITINDSEIDKGSVETGTLSLNAVLPSGAAFECDDTSIYGLPLLDVSVAIPTLPLSVNNLGMYGEIEKTISIDSLEFHYEFSCDATLTATMTYNINGDTASDYAYIPYKIKDETGVVVDSGEFFLGPLSVGDTVRENVYITGVELGKNYSIEFSDYSW